MQLGRTNLPTFPMAKVAILILAKDLYNPTIKQSQPLLCKDENHASN
jgi:hypothetical protein